ncbi:MAG: D-glycero-beta-D-manno-heptose-7-phosphate kinase [Sphingobacteriales bacterium]|nr:MAG: D-glycero-beta-D-manno-heptose-7-phosphate kinase [Sphingobacteriales bacterium]
MLSTQKLHLTKQELDNIFSKFAETKVLVIGDVMLDSYWWGKVERISPEAPVPVVNVSKREYRLGGAANVALNLRKLGAQPTVCAVVGKDVEGDVLVNLLGAEGISADGIIYTENRPTTVKTRVIGNKNQLLRIDAEECDLLPEEENFKLTERIKSLLENTDLVLFEDYDKGVICEKLIQEIVQAAREKNIPVVVDPKKRNFLHYKNVTLFKPNLRELADGLKLDIDSQSSITEIEEATKILLQRLQSDMAMITLSERGVYIADEKNAFLLPAHVRNIYDVSGAGDTVISVAALALQAGANTQTIAALANLAGGLVCEKLGVVPIDAGELYTEAEREICC